MDYCNTVKLVGLMLKWRYIIKIVTQQFIIIV